LTLPQLTLAIDSIDDLSVVSHWTCDETSGVRYDSNTTNSNDLTDNNTVGYATGLLGNACDFEASNSEYLSITDANQIGLEPDIFSASAWVKKESNDANQRVIMGKDSSGGDYTWRLSASPDSPDYPLCANANIAGTNRQICNSGGSLATWYHVVSTYNGSSFCLYINGVIVGSCSSYSGTLADGSNDFRVASFAHASGYYLDGLVDEMTFDDEAWDSTTVTAVYNSGTPLPYTYSAPATSSTSTTATSSSTTFEDDNLVFLLGVIIFFLTFLWFGFVASAFKKSV